MKLLFDQNISFRVVRQVSEIYPESQQVNRLGLKNATDIKIWNYAKQNNFSIVTFDADYYDIASLRGHPPKIIWLRIGNTSTENIAKLLIEKYDTINDFIENPNNKDIACLEIE